MNVVQVVCRPSGLHEGRRSYVVAATAVSRSPPRQHCQSCDYDFTLEGRSGRLYIACFRMSRAHASLSHALETHADDLLRPLTLNAAYHFKWSIYDTVAGILSETHLRPLTHSAGLDTLAPSAVRPRNAGILLRGRTNCVGGNQVSTVLGTRPPNFCQIPGDTAGHIELAHQRTSAGD